MNCHCCSGNCRKSGSYRNRNRVVQRYACDRCGKSFSESQPLDGMRVEFGKACQVVELLCESVGIRAIERLTGISKPTVLSILETAGQKAAALLDERVHNLNAKQVQADEIYSFVGCRREHVLPGETERGDQWTFLAIDRESKLVISWLVGKHTRENALRFMGDLKRRTANRFQLTTDNWGIYSGASGVVSDVMGGKVDYATEQKFFARGGASPGVFLPRRVVSVRRHRRMGNPDIKLATTCHAERTNLSVRLFNRRFTRCTLGYSKKLDNLRHAVALFVWHFNFARVHSAHGKTPAQAAGLADRAWTVAELLAR